MTDTTPGPGAPGYIEEPTAGAAPQPDVTDTPANPVIPDPAEAAEPAEHEDK